MNPTHHDPRGWTLYHADSTNEILGSILPRMNPTMAWGAKCDNVVRNKPQVRVFAPSFLVMQVERAAIPHMCSFVSFAASHTGVRVSGKNASRQGRPLRRSVDRLPLWGTAALVVVMERAPLAVHRVPLPKHRRVRLACGHNALLASFFGMLPSAPGGDAASIAIRCNPAPLFASRDTELHKLGMDTFWVSADHRADGVS